MEVKAVNRERVGPRVMDVLVIGVAEVSSPADRASLRVTLSSSKPSVDHVTSSVSRRLEYILQALRQQGINEEDTSVRKFLHRDTEMYRMDVEVMVTFSDFSKMEQICSILLEKLDKSVCVGMPRFYHSPECMSQIRLRACVSAVENAQQKASKLSQLLGQSLGPPMLVREEETQERTHEEEEDEEGGGRGREQDSLPLPNFPHIPTFTASSQVSVFFGFRDGNRKNL
ncbi:interleukin-1 receptor-associated kinase 1-binding protein 1 homolog [Cololabis saira]|uniref:interleukin-1 receptor-associated kinase 1-binding protein 1 homolog n=1 Tax=Cololabis saira TaxID=129043 RepID=UPI002AD26485|nr:interleukin-1 receptor-associated kinase 1-binding protein 1 homolog [Cololabis saira]